MTTPQKTSNVKPAIVILMPTALALARRIAEAVGGEVHAAASRVDGADQNFDDVKSHVRALFSAGRPIIAVMASGALIRLLAPLLADKRSEPPVLCVSEDGASVVPLLGGHHGANDLARAVAEALNAHAAITTAGDLRFGVALDAPPEGYVLANREQAKTVMAELVAGASVRLVGDADWLTASRLAFDDESKVTLTVTDQRRTAGPLELVYHPKTLVLGMGCERHASVEEAIALAQQALDISGLAAQSLGAVASIDVKADEAAMHAVAKHFGVAARFFSAERLEQERPRLQNPSEVVFAEVGCHGVAEGAALAMAGSDGVLALPKIKSKGVTAALGRSVQPIKETSLGRARGTLFVVGIGPGSNGWRSPEVSRMVAASSDLVGYSLYLDLLGSLAEGKTRHDFDLGKEEARVVHAMELAGEGKTVALVCSGDAGIYAMATLVFELLDKGGISAGAQRIEVQVSPGISALQAAAARIGAPLGHDFCTISLSDLLTPWKHIQRRVKAAGEGDFVIAFYNPVSMKRRTQLAYARDQLLTYRPADTPVILATNLGRPGETVRVVPLAGLNVDDVDMLTVVIVGSSESRTVKTGDGKTWVYTPRGYSGKADTAMQKDA
ncbi:precorrin-3B C(17)-methyltransferase [Agrobacterium vitis]|uniref:precorrin-3B C(17)-methyltransferase n=1 Tax=Agrobacterium vitis TaxID=373 RepID=UPI0012E8844C|nr:precorrin-3B C(17)-methyltransferase [Agrobacterium vitis]MCF1468399.1 precorrin-3B C(17)-methyltransferase [Agrobacterium vitis]MVA33767.1 precorrin-3B C(17)-methyltransferase [Agrobacterium vitis]